MISLRLTEAVTAPDLMAITSDRDAVLVPDAVCNGQDAETDLSAAAAAGRNRKTRSQGRVFLEVK